MTSYKSIAIIALVLMLAAIPLASAEWMNDAWYPSDVYANMISGDTVVHDPVTGVDSKYNPNVGSKYDIQQDPNTYSGSAEVRIRSEMATLNPTMMLVNDAMPDVNKTIEVNPNAITDITGLPAGNFTLTLDNYNVPDEVAHFKIATGQQEPTYVVFIGQAASQPREEVSAPVSTCKDLDILDAFYGGNFAEGQVWNIVHRITDHTKYVTATSTVQGLVSNDFLHISADYGSQHYNALFGDPNVGTVKGLYVLYTCTVTEQHGKHTITVPVVHSKYVSEQTDLNIP